MKFERSWTGNWENAFRGLRHPMESYNKSDSSFGIAENDIFLDTNNIELTKQWDLEARLHEKRVYFNKRLIDCDEPVDN